MKYKEFKEKIEVWGRTYGYITRVIIGDFETTVEVESNGVSYSNADISNVRSFVLDIDWIFFGGIEEHAREELFNIILQLVKTPIEDRRDEKSFIIPLPGLVTTDGRQQYLSYKDGYYFASRRNEGLKQEWKERYLVPEEYRQFAVERQYDYLYDMYIDEFEDYDEGKS